MTPEQRIKHEFLLLQGKLGDDSQFFHYDKVPETLDGDYQLTFDAVYWQNIDVAEMHSDAAWYSVKEMMRRNMILLCNDTKKKIDSIIELLETEKSDAEKT
jgi:hypothetical protein